MNIDRTGFILYTFKYETCVKFYSEILDLEVMFSTDMLTCFKFGESYLMVELDDDVSTEKGQNTTQDRIRTCLRMNVKNVKEYADQLSSQGIEVDYQEHDWGTIAKFLDPDGNLCAFKDSAKFEKQISSSSDKY